LWIAAPLMLGISLATVDEWYEKFMGVALETGSVSYLGYARKLMMVPVAVIGQALGAAALPVLARYHAANQPANLNAVLSRTLRVALGLGLLAAAATCALARPMVEFFFRQGRFDAVAAEAVAQLLFVMAFATPAWVTQQVASRAFYAREDTWRPMLLGTAVALAVIPLYLMLRAQYGVVGLAAAGVFAMSANAIATLAWARVRHGAPDVASLVATFVRIAPTALAGAFAASLVQTGAVGRTAAALDLAFGGAAFGAVALAGVFWFGDAPTRSVLSSALARLRARLRV
jgi:putative peptidoglycan lipid II flippase